MLFPRPHAQSLRRARRAVMALALGAGGVLACSELFTALPDDGDLLDAPLAELTPAELAAFIRGDGEFGRPFSAVDGLGPIFNDVSCANCHSGDGRGDERNILIRIGDESNGYLSTLGGPQIQTRAIPGAVAETTPSGYPVSLRLPPPVFGVGLIEAIPDAAILAHADSTDANGDGISGRPNWVGLPPYLDGAGLAIGRFGRKAQVSSLLQQVVEAYHQDMGITSDFRPHENVNPLARAQTLASDHAADPEVSIATVEAVVHYVRTLAPPAPGVLTATRRDGETTFAAIGCATCHVPVLRTGPHVVSALANRDVQLYSDLLLHDMGDALADHRVDGSATGREWRTAPLWGSRLVPRFLNGRGLYLHDGRARTIDEAIRMHGGEAQRARDAYAALTEPQRAALLSFVESR